MKNIAFGTAELLRGIAAGEFSAQEALATSIAHIEATDGRVNAFTGKSYERARREAAAVDAMRSRGEALPPLAGLPYAVKNLFDIQGEVTLAGSIVNRGNPVAGEDAFLVQRLRAAGAVLVGSLNMDEYAYGFTTENTHYGPAHNPHDLNRIAGGSSGGSGAAVAAQQVPLALGSDTNGSIRVPASLCGIFGLKPTFGRLPRTGSYPFISSLDHLGPFARSVRDLALFYDAMQGPETGAARDPGCAQRAIEPTLAQLGHGTRGLRIGVLGGYFRERAMPEALSAVDRVAEALGAHQTVELPMVEAGRAAAFLITNAEGAALHLQDLRTRPQDFEPLSRDRFLAGALIPAAWVARAQRVRRVYAEEVARLFERFDILLAASTPCAATPIGAEWFELNGQRLPVRPNMGVLTQPISCIGLPVCGVPVWGAHASLPIGVQVIAAPWREDLALRVAAVLEGSGVAQAPIANL